MQLGHLQEYYRLHFRRIRVDLRLEISHRRNRGHVFVPARDQLNSRTSPHQHKYFKFTSVKSLLASIRSIEMIEQKYDATLHGSERVPAYHTDHIETARSNLASQTENVVRRFRAT